MQEEWSRNALMHAAKNGNLECVKALASFEKGMKRNGQSHINGTYYYDATALAFTLDGNTDSYKRRAQHLYQFPEERNTSALNAVKTKFDITRSLHSIDHHT